MNTGRHELLLLCAVSMLAVCGTAAPQQAAPPVLTNQLNVSVRSTRTTLDRATGRLRSDVDALVANGSGEWVEPADLVVGVREGPVERVVVTGTNAEGGPGSVPYGSWHYDLTRHFADHYLPSGSYVREIVEFERDKTVRFAYRLTPHGSNALERPPILDVDPLRYALGPAETLTIPMTASDPDGDEVVLESEAAVAVGVLTATSGVSAAGTYRFEASDNGPGDYVVLFRAVDTTGLRDEKRVEIFIGQSNAPPAIVMPARIAVTEGGLVSIPLTLSDPDGGAVSAEALSLPADAFLVQYPAAVLYAPAMGSTGTHDVVCRAYDGALYSTAATTRVDVTRYGDGGGGETPRLTLHVDPVESPTLLEGVHVSGTVNVPPTSSAHRVSAALITGVSPTSGRQGETLDVGLSCGLAGAFATHFASGRSLPDFGGGITVESVIVSNATHLTARIRLAASAAAGPRAVCVRTGSETAAAVIAFSVVAGTASITGTLVDAENGAPVANALVTVEGTGYRTGTGSDGSFTLSGLPPGAYRLVINGPDHALTRVPVVVSAGSTIALGDIATEATVLIYDGLAPVGVSLGSVIGRGLCDRRRNRHSYEDAEALVRDALLLVGGPELAVYDAEGNALNPYVEGNGLLTVDADMVRRLAEKVERGDESYSLVDLLFSLSWGMRWENDTPPPLDEWLAALQTIVTQAWADPALPENRIVLLIFNSGTGLLPDPPVLSPETRLNALQAHLFLGSFLTAAFSPDYADGGTQSLRNKAVGDGDAIQTKASLSGPPAQGVTRIYTQYWRGFYQAQRELTVGADGSSPAAGAYVEAVSRLAATLVCMPGLVSVAGGVSVTPALHGIVTDRLIGAYASYSQAVKLPQVPPKATIAAHAEVDEHGQVSVRLTFANSSSSLIHRNFTFVYRLYRFKGPSYVRDLVDEIPVGYDTVIEVQDKSGATYHKSLGDLEDFELGAYRNARWSLTDADPIPMVKDPTTGIEVQAANATWFYALTVTRVKHARVTDPLIRDTMYSLTAPWWSAFMTESPSLLSASQRRNTVQTSDYSDPILMRLSPEGEIVYDTYELEVNPDSRVAYVAEPMAAGTNRPGRIYAIESLGVGERTVLANTGFKAPGHRGLAMDSHGLLYTDNVASDAMFGGRIFGFNTDEDLGLGAVLDSSVPGLDDVQYGNRYYAGTINYFSDMLFYARPTSCGTSAMGPGAPGSVAHSPEDLYVLDEIDEQVKKVPVQAMAWPANRRCGKLFATLPFAAAGQDMEVLENGTAELLVQQVPAPRLNVSVKTLSRVAIGTDFDVVVTVGNPTPSTIDDVHLSAFDTEGEGAVTVLELPLVTTASLAPNKSATFLYRCHSVESGEVVFRTQARGNVAVSGGGIETIASSVTRSAPLTIGTTLEVLDVWTEPEDVRPGDTFEIHAYVRPTGIGAVNDVSLIAIEREPLADPIGQARYDSGPFPTTANIQRDKAVEFVNTFVAEDMGWVAYKLEATGTDEASGEAVKALHYGVDVMISPLGVGASVDPPNVEFRTNVTVSGTVTVTNLSTETVYDVSARWAWKFDHVGFRVIETNSPPVDIGPGGTSGFDFVFKEPVEPGAYALEAIVSAQTADGASIPCERPSVRLSIGPSVKGRVWDVALDLSSDITQPLFAPQGLVERGVPVTNVLVRILELPGAEYEARTDENGDFEIPVPDAQLYTVEGVYGYPSIGFKVSLFAAVGSERHDIDLPVSLVLQTQQLLKEHMAIEVKAADFPFPTIDWVSATNGSIGSILTTDIKIGFNMPEVVKLGTMMLEYEFFKGPQTPRYYSIRNPVGERLPNQWDGLLRMNTLLAYNLRRFKEAAGMNSAAAGTIVGLFLSWIQKDEMVSDNYDKHVFQKVEGTDGLGYFAHGDQVIQTRDSEADGNYLLGIKLAGDAVEFLLEKTGVDPTYSEDVSSSIFGIVEQLFGVYSSIRGVDFKDVIGKSIDAVFNYIGLAILQAQYRDRAQIIMTHAIRRAWDVDIGDDVTWQVISELYDHDAQVMSEVNDAGEAYGKVKGSIEYVNAPLSAVNSHIADSYLASAKDYSEIYTIADIDKVSPKTRQMLLDRGQEATLIGETLQELGGVVDSVFKVTEIAEALRLLLEGQVIQIGRFKVAADHGMERDPLFFQSMPASYVRGYLEVNGLRTD